MSSPPRSRRCSPRHAPARAGDAAVGKALADSAGVENPEERMVPGRIDPTALAHLRTRP
nr:hypothetical protein [Micromonospora pisi]